MKYLLAFSLILLSFNSQAFQDESQDSLLSVIDQLQTELANAKKEHQKEVVLDYRIKEFVPAFLTAWEKLDESKEGNEMLKFFSENFFVNGVNVDKNNTPEIVIAEGPVFKKRLEAYAKSKKFDVTYEEPRYLYSILNKDIFYVVFEVSAFQVRPEDKFSTNMIISMVGRVNGGDLKIGNLNWFEIAEKE